MCHCTHSAQLTTFAVSSELQILEHYSLGMHNPIIQELLQEATVAKLEVWTEATSKVINFNC